MQDPSVILMVILLTVPALATLAMSVTRSKSPTTRSIILATMLSVELLVSLAGSIAGSTLVTLMSWGSSLGASSSLFFLHTYLAHISIFVFCVATMLLVASHWALTELRDGYFVAGSLFAVVFVALSASLTPLAIALVAYAVLKQAQDISPRERTNAISLDICAIAMVMAASALLGTENEVSVLGFQNLQGTGVVLLALSGIIILSQARTVGKASLPSQVVALASLACGGLVWLRMARYSNSALPLRQWLLAAGLIGALFSAWRFWRHTHTDALPHASDFWVSLLVCSGFVDSQITLALYIATELFAAAIFVIPNQPAQGRLSKVTHIAGGYFLAGLPGTLSGLAILALFAGLVDTEQWIASALLLLANSAMVAGAWWHFSHRDDLEDDQPLAVLVVAGAIVLVLVLLGLAPSLAALPGSRFVLIVSLPTYPPLATWLPYTLWLVPVILGTVISRRTIRKSFVARRSSELLPQGVKSAARRMQRTLAASTLKIEHALETDWYMPWILIFAAIIGLLLIGSWV